MAIDLEQWRKAQSMTYQALADLIGCSVSQARRYALGQERMSDQRLDKILAASKGEVDLYALHRRRMAFLAGRRRELATVPIVREA